MKIKLDTFDWLPDVMEANIYTEGRAKTALKNTTTYLEAFAGAPRYESEEYTDGFGVARRGEYSMDFPDAEDSLEFLYPEHDPKEDNSIPAFFQVEKGYEAEGVFVKNHRAVEFGFTLVAVKWEDGKLVATYEMEFEEVV